jgi:uncharacterized protein DUF5994
MTPGNSDRTTAIPPAGQSAPQGLRLRLDPTLARGGILDGGWWPRSRDPDAELPDLIAGLESSLGVITRVALNSDPWNDAPRRLAVNGRRVHVGWFRAMNAQTICLTRAFQDRFVLLVVPPEATTAAAATAMAMAADPANSTRPADLLAASGIGALDTTLMPRRHARRDAPRHYSTTRVPGPTAMSGGTRREA